MESVLEHEPIESRFFLFRKSFRLVLRHSLLTQSLAQQILRAIKHTRKFRKIRIAFLVFVVVAALAGIVVAVVRNDGLKSIIVRWRTTRNQDALKSQKSQPPSARSTLSSQTSAERLAEVSE